MGTPSIPLAPIFQINDAILQGQPYVIYPMAPHLFPTFGLQQYVSEASTAPSAPPLSTAGSPTASLAQNTPQYWRPYGLDPIADMHQIFLNYRQGDKYIITDTMKSHMYTGIIDMETTCFCSSSPKGPGVTFNLTSRNGQHCLVVHSTSTEYHMCYSPETTVSVCIPPDVSLGTVEGNDVQFTLNNTSGDVLCYIVGEKTNCCACTFPSYQVIPAGFPHDVGTIAHFDSGLIITFPAVLDVPARTLLLCFALILQYTREEKELFNQSL